MSKIHRALGWATTHPDPASLADRILENGVDGEVEAFVRAEISRQAGADRGSRLFLEANRREAADYPRRFSSLMHQVCGPDFREPDWIIAPPAFASDWFRSDDSIDYYSVRFKPGWEPPRIDALPHAPYPYEGRGDCGSAEVPEIIRLLAREFGFDTAKLVPALATWWL